ncbi:regulatory protein RecX [Pelosinus fermentans]|nr:RecX family transcriptional regulator [Pelosinus fermentans]
MIHPLNNHNDIWQYSLHLVTRRSYSEKELQQKLEYKDYSCDDIEKVFSRLKEYGYINDIKLANHLFHKYLETNKYSTKQILYKLKLRGLPDAILSEIARDFDDIEEWKSALKVVTARFKSFDTTTKEKIYRYLASRGFSATSIHKVLQTLSHCDK